MAEGATVEGRRSPVEGRYLGSVVAHHDLGLSALSDFQQRGIHETLGWTSNHATSPSHFAYRTKRSVARARLPIAAALAAGGPAARHFEKTCRKTPIMRSAATFDGPHRATRCSRGSVRTTRSNSSASCRVHPDPPRAEMEAAASTGVMSVRGIDIPQPYVNSRDSPTPLRPHCTTCSFTGSFRDRGGVLKCAGGLADVMV
jgi:hypothetical protein